MWIASLAARPLRAGTIENYRWALHNLHTGMGLPSLIDSNQQVKRMIEGVKKTQGMNGSRPPRLPVTPAVIRAVTLLLTPGMALRALSAHVHTARVRRTHLPLRRACARSTGRLRSSRMCAESSADHRMLIAAMWVATSAMLRPGEIGVESASKPKRMLTLASINPKGTTPPSYDLTLAESKTDYYSRGVPLPVSGPAAVSALHFYLSKRSDMPGPKHPLFVRADGSPLTHKWLVDTVSALVLRAGVPLRDRITGRTCVGVSFRSGGATALAEASA